MFSESNIMTRDPTHDTTLLIDLSAGKHLQILGKRRLGVCAKVTFAITSDISETKQSRAKVTQSVYRNTSTAYRLVTNLKIWGELWPTFPGSTIFPQRISHTLFVGARRNLAVLGVWSIETYSPNFVNFDLVVP